MTYSKDWPGHESLFVMAQEPEYPFTILDAQGSVIDRAANVESTVSVLYGDLSYHEGEARKVICPPDSVAILRQYAAENADCWGIPVDVIEARA